MSASGMSIEFAGRAADRLGIAMWQADGNGPERAAIGHSFDTPIGSITSHYYIASRDYVDHGATGGVVATSLRGTWPRLTAALAEYRRSLKDLLIRLPLTTAGADRQGEDWVYRNDVETRQLYPKTPVPLLFCHAPLLEFPAARLVLTETYKGAQSFADVRLVLMSAPIDPTYAANLDGAAKEVADALFADIADRPMRIVVDAIDLILTDVFESEGRIHGRYANIPSARLEVVE
jgi:hypothetical protein